MIINCPDCGHKVSSNAPLCPYCGCSGKKLRETAENQAKGCGIIILAVIIFSVLAYAYMTINDKLGLGLSSKTIITLVITTVPSIILWWKTAPKFYRYVTKNVSGNRPLSLFLLTLYFALTGLVIFGICNFVTDKMSARKHTKTETIEGTNYQKQSNDGTNEVKPAPKTIDDDSAPVQSNTSRKTNVTEKDIPSELESEASTEQHSKVKTEVANKDTTPTVSLENLLKLTEK